MVQAASSTTVGGGSRSPSGKSASLKSGNSGSAVRNRKATSSTAVRRSTSAGGPQNMWRFYTEDSPGIKVGPVPVLVMSLLFIASVFMLHIWGKYTRQ
ncbi:protein transport protein Sec61 subunit beta [Hydra vulgaris]|uniref:protein transport protein Sec61 subunit beta n=1 Tax=Hydra vulgaris TaxID=6087 RepID=UPI000192505D|nr:protein transport protein Sec61 subunit beta [Hydra vulgaris]